MTKLHELSSIAQGFLLTGSPTLTLQLTATRTLVGVPENTAVNIGFDTAGANFDFNWASSGQIVANNPGYYNVQTEMNVSRPVDAGSAKMVGDLYLNASPTTVDGYLLGDFTDGLNVNTVHLANYFIFLNAGDELQHLVYWTNSAGGQNDNIELKATANTNVPGNVMYSYQVRIAKTLGVPTNSI